MSMKMKARDLGLDDLRYDVEVVEPTLRPGANAIRVVGQLHKIEGPYTRVVFGAATEEVVDLWVGPSGAAERVRIEAGSDVTVNRDPQRPAVGHWGSGVVPV